MFAQKCVNGVQRVKQHPRRLPFHQKATVQMLLNDMLDQGIIEPASGPWSSPIVLVTKKDGTPRFCIDYRKFNKVTRKDAHPLPRIDDTLDALAGSKWFSTIDLACGYWQVEVDPADREKNRFYNTIWFASILCHAIWLVQCTWYIPAAYGDSSLRVALDYLSCLFG